MIQPHGGKLVERVLRGPAKTAILAKAASMPRLRLDSELVSDVENICLGVYSPLEGFLGQDDFRHVLNQRRLCSDLPWTIPIVLAVGREEYARLRKGADILLVEEGDRPVAVLHLAEKFTFDKGDGRRPGPGRRHPGVDKVIIWARSWPAPWTLLTVSDAL
jgi:sulfate adenylyltransferase